jgi:eukaryotic-like serine/threonine-protein kinase
MIGRTLGPYRVLAKLGEGGMGQVYRATDTALDRHVAIKVLPESFALDAERVARFTREAKTLAALNHPNIAGIYGIEQSGGTPALVMELVEGEDLADLIAHGEPEAESGRSRLRDSASAAPRGGPAPRNLSLDDTLKIARQIADALEAAHEQGIIHRDLKPANIKVRADGTVKVLDFGLAKALAPSGASATADLASSPTITSPAMTQMGMILGTAAYMAPEQARGKPVDRRADIWAFGCVLFEMLTGRTPFPAGETVSDAVASVLLRDPDWALLPAATPAPIIRLLRRCLRKDPDERLPHIGVARLDLDEARVTPVQPDARTPSAGSTARAAERLAFAAVVMVLLAGAAWWRTGEALPAAVPAEMRLEITTPPSADQISLAIAPDGGRIVFVAESNRRPALWLRPLDADTARPLRGTEGASYPFWSPDSRSIGFFADAKLKRIDLDGAVRVLANAPGPFSPGSWNRDGVILFQPIPGESLQRVSAEGGAVQPVVRVDASSPGGYQDPRFLPDGEHFFYRRGGGEGREVLIGRLAGMPPKRLLEGTGSPVYVPSGHLLFVRHGTLFAQPFDLERLELTGAPHAIAADVVDPADGGVAALSASDNGTIAFRRGTGGQHRQFIWFDRSGRPLGTLGPSDEDTGMPALSPDGRVLAVERSVNGNSDVWLIDLARDVPDRFTFGAAHEVFPTWSPDGSRVAFSSTRNGGVNNLYVKDASPDAAEQVLLEDDTHKALSDWSPDGRHLLYSAFHPQTQHDIFVLPLDGGSPSAVVATAFEERGANFSPDGNWIAYQSNESGQFEVYVQPFPGPGPRVRISTAGGAQARWRADGRELFYVALDGTLMAMPMRLERSPARAEPGAAVALFRTRLRRAVEHLDGQNYVVTRDGRRFLVNTREDVPASPIGVLLNWRPQAP